MQYLVMCTTLLVSTIKLKPVLLSANTYIQIHKCMRIDIDNAYVYIHIHMKTCKYVY